MGSWLSERKRLLLRPVACRRVGRGSCALDVKPGSVRPYGVILVMIERTVDASRFHSQGRIQVSFEIPRRDTPLPP